VADDAGQDRQRNIVDRADADAGHHQIKEHVDTGTQFGDARQIAGGVGRRGGADADQRTGKPGCAQDLGGSDAGRPLTFGEFGMRLGSGHVVAFPRMGHDPGQNLATVKDLSDLEQRGRAG
jgi:hypothetical protein